MFNLRKTSSWKTHMGFNLVVSYEAVLKQNAFVPIRNEKY